MASIQNLDTADLSKEDLLKMLKRMQQTLSDTQEKLSSTQTELDSIKSRLTAAEAELEQSNAEKRNWATRSSRCARFLLKAIDRLLR